MSGSAIQSQVISAGAAAGTVVSAWALSAQMGRPWKGPQPCQCPGGIFALQPNTSLRTRLLYNVAQSSFSSS